MSPLNSYAGVLPQAAQDGTLLSSRTLAAALNARSQAAQAGLELIVQPRTTVDF